MDLNKISNFIKAKRKELGITQDELAEKLFVTEKAISRWETDRGTPDISLLIPLSKELDISVSELLNEKERLFNSIFSNNYHPFNIIAVYSFNIKRNPPNYCIV